MILSVAAIGLAAMPSSTHEALIELFRQRPSLAAELLGGAFGVEVPDFQSARMEPGEFADVAPTEYRADAVVDATVAAWCAAPIEFGHPGLTLRPLASGPNRVPVLTDLGLDRRTPEPAVLSAMAHGRDPDRSGVLDALLGALADVDSDRANLYCDVASELPAAVRSHLKALMISGTYEYQSDLARRYFLQGQAEGKAEAVLAVLDARGIDVPTDARTCITGCSDLDQLDAWVRRATLADSIRDLLDGAIDS